MANFSEILPNIYHIPTRNASCFLVRGEKDILVDTGNREARDYLIQALEELEAFPRLSMIFLTHAHHDHCGNVAAVARRSEAQVAIFSEDAVRLRRGKNAKGEPNHLLVKLLKPFLKEPNNKWHYDPDLLLTNFQDLSTFGLKALAVAMPGHTQGSGALLVGDTLIAGDHLMNFTGKKPIAPIIMYDKEAWQQSSQMAMDVANTILIAHGGPMYDIGVLKRHVKEDAS